MSSLIQKIINPKKTEKSKQEDLSKTLDWMMDYLRNNQSRNAVKRMQTKHEMLISLALELGIFTNRDNRKKIEKLIELCRLD